MRTTINTDELEPKEAIATLERAITQMHDEIKSIRAAQVIAAGPRFKIGEEITFKPYKKSNDRKAIVMEHRANNEGFYEYLIEYLAGANTSHTLSCWKRSDEIWHRTTIIKERKTNRAAVPASSKELIDIQKKLINEHLNRVEKG